MGRRPLLAARTCFSSTGRREGAEAIFDLPFVANTVSSLAPLFEGIVATDASGRAARTGQRPTEGRDGRDEVMRALIPFLVSFLEGITRFLRVI